MSLSFSPSLAQYLQRFENSVQSKAPVAVFDCDGTIIKGDIGEAMFYYQVEHFLLRVNPANIWLDHPKRDELDNLYTALSTLPIDKRKHDRRFVSFSEMMVEWYFDQLMEGKTEKACSDIVKLFTKYSAEEVERIAARTLTEELSSPVMVSKIGKHTVPKGIRYIREAVDLLKELQRLGFDIWAISGSNTWSVRPVFEPLGIPRNRIIGIELLPSSNIFSTKIHTPIPVLQGKVDALRQFTTSAPAIVVSDSTYDVPLFHYSAGAKVLINSRMETSYTFFKQSQIVQNDSWFVVENPTLLH
ncbi:MAG: haloacid dehalogenase-like hydrolase [Ignavibacteriae bacterium]|nr:haloacid dehalogenase-like hydrolase [Ignavibacteriota bacterium]